MIIINILAIHTSKAIWNSFTNRMNWIYSSKCICHTVAMASADIISDYTGHYSCVLLPFK